MIPSRLYIVFPLLFCLCWPVCKIDLDPTVELEDTHPPYNNIKMSMQLFNATDAFIGQNNVERLGFDKNKTLEEMIELATEHKCPLVVKDGRGKWYLKGQGKTYEEIEAALNRNKENIEHKNVKCYVLRF